MLITVTLALPSISGAELKIPIVLSKGVEVSRFLIDLIERDVNARDNKSWAPLRVTEWSSDANIQTFPTTSKELQFIKQ
jgi:hypothetical protein